MVTLVKRSACRIAQTCTQIELSVIVRWLTLKVTSCDVIVVGDCLKTGSIMWWYTAIMGWTDTTACYLLNDFNMYFGSVSNSACFFFASHFFLLL